MFRRYNITSDEDLRAVAERMGMSLGHNRACHVEHPRRKRAVFLAAR
jgi:hypothetical protein